ncbi:hypothetical protein DL240_19140 [Lujinxingia litoralis]|uniref:PEGA domain-containing protein n=1 Tax=Lujinxingia litoralis TaxID=2211119 RepID=A0A328C0V5_9DELT|nr:PEGA domain-containing protein [Lujinxingia litoralis]RAL20023.1 hypothetical protein DL240_19140 [Lujinxingia litoralis]
MRQAHSQKIVYALYTLIALALVTAAALLIQERDAIELLATGDDTDFAAYQATSEAPAPEAPERDDVPTPNVELAELPEPEDLNSGEWEILDPLPPEELSAPAPVEVGQQKRRLRPAHLTVVTDFSQAQVTVNGLPYPAYSEQGTNEGMILPAGGPHRVVVDYGGNQRVYELALRPNEERVLMVELSGYSGGSPPRPSVSPSKPAEKPSEPEPESEPADGQGRITVYSRPRGAVVVNGSDRGQQTPGTVEVEAGRHEVQVRYEDGEVSEKKVVRVREGSRIKLFFRQSK